MGSAENREDWRGPSGHLVATERGSGAANVPGKQRHDWRMSPIVLPDDRYKWSDISHES